MEPSLCRHYAKLFPFSCRTRSKYFEIQSGWELEAATVTIKISDELLHWFEAGSVSGDGGINGRIRLND